MKAYIIAPFIVIFSVSVHAQNSVGIGTSSPAVSAVLDINSTTKGMMIPRMTTAQRSVISSPSMGLLVFDTDTKTIWAYDGTAWKNLVNSGGAFSLPYSQSINTGVPGIQIINQGLGASLEGLSSNEYGTGVSAKSTGNLGWGLNAYTNKPGAQTIYAYADSGTVFTGLNNYVGNTNTLMMLTNFGLGKTTTFQLANSASTSPNVQIAGNHVGEQLLVYQTGAANNKPAISVINSGTAEAVRATSTSGTGITSISVSGSGIVASSTSGMGISALSTTNYAVRGITSSTTGFAGVYGGNNGTVGTGVQGVANAAIQSGVYGTSTNGKGVQGVSENGTGVQGSSTSGTGLYGTSGSGYALQTVGNISISGGNTNPANGAVLTSDATGNAVWKGRTVAFKVTGVANGYATITDDVAAKIHFKDQEFDLGNNYLTLTENGNTTQGSAFYTPVNGLYHFSVQVTTFATANLIDPTSRENVYVRRVRNGGDVVVMEYYKPDSDGRAEHAGSFDLVLNSGDKIYITVLFHQSNNLGTSTAQLTDYFADTWFSGFLVKEL